MQRHRRHEYHLPFLPRPLGVDADSRVGVDVILPLSVYRDEVAGVTLVASKTTDDFSRHYRVTDAFIGRAVWE